MFSRLKDWFKAYKICKKYGLKLKLYLHREMGYYNHVSQTIGISAFSSEFMDIFLHELGHHIHHLKVNYPEFYEDGASDVRMGNKATVYRCIFKKLETEYQASRFALKAGADKKRLREWLTSYIKPAMQGREHIPPEIFENYLNSVARVSKIFYKQ